MRLSVISVQTILLSILNSPLVRDTMGDERTQGACSSEVSSHTDSTINIENSPQIKNFEVALETYAETVLPPNARVKQAFFPRLKKTLSLRTLRQNSGHYSVQENEEELKNNAEGAQEPNSRDRLHLLQKPKMLTCEKLRRPFSRLSRQTKKEQDLEKNAETSPGPSSGDRPAHLRRLKMTSSSESLETNSRENNPQRKEQELEENGKSASEASN